MGAYNNSKSRYGSVPYDPTQAQSFLHLEKSVVTFVFSNALWFCWRRQLGVISVFGIIWAFTKANALIVLSA